MSSGVARTQVARSEQTSRRLIAAARRLFARDGFAQTSTPDIVREAGVTRGALYHHFSDKTALFAVVVREERLLVAMAVNAAVANDQDGPIKAIMAGCDTFLEEMQREGRKQILLLDAPAVLGSSDAPETNMLITCLYPALRAGIEAQVLRPLSVEVVAALIQALFERAALAAPDTFADYRKAIKALVRGLKA